MTATSFVFVNNFALGQKVLVLQESSIEMVIQLLHSSLSVGGSAVGFSDRPMCFRC